MQREEILMTIPGFFATSVELFYVARRRLKLSAKPEVCR
jgi:hypothetical protein